MASPSLEGPAAASGFGAVTAVCDPARVIISICLCRVWCNVYGHARAGISVREPPIAMLSAALARHCIRQYAAALHAASRGERLHQQSSYVVTTM